MALLVAVDIGGTFTDLVALDEDSGRLIDAKSLTTPHNLVEGILDCLRKSGVDVVGVRDLVHGSTIAINTVIEGTGAKTALVTTMGMRDVYRIGRGNRPEAYNLFFHRPKPLVPRRLTFEVEERCLPSGEELVPLSRADVEAVADRLAALGVEAVAVTFLHAYANPRHEEEAGEILRRRLPDAYISLSSRIVREFREYERTSTTVLNAYVGPKVTRYLHELERSLAESGFQGSLSIMQSSGGIMAKEVAVTRPVNMMESGPVGGIIASAEVGRRLGFTEVIAFDMGGTTAKASLITEGRPSMADIYYIGGYASGQPVMIPVVDVVEVGTGGGSIAWIDEVGALKVGPRSAGADPGPIAYRRGGTEPTITDANVVLGRIGAEDFLGGEMPLDREAARRGLAERVAGPLRLDVLEAARAVVAIAIHNMALAVRQVSVEKGFDPRDFTLVASGGAGPVHALAIARALHIPRVVIPRFPAHFSALGMLLTDHRLDFVRTAIAPLETLDFDAVRATYAEMVADCRNVLGQHEPLTFQIVFDMRYLGQEFTLPVPVTEEAIRRGDRAAIEAGFHEVHERRYGHKGEGEPMEVVNVRLVATRSRAKPSLPRLAGDRTPAASFREVYFDDARPVRCPVYDRQTLPPGFAVKGPALVREYASTTVVFPGDVLTVADTGELVVRVGEGS